VAVLREPAVGAGFSLCTALLGKELGKTTLARSRRRVAGHGRWPGPTTAASDQSRPQGLLTTGDSAGSRGQTGQATHRSADRHDGDLDGLAGTCDRHQATGPTCGGRRSRGKQWTCRHSNNPLAWGWWTTPRGGRTAGRTGQGRRGELDDELRG